nr:hypothetical protein [Marinobacter persicus]
MADEVRSLAGRTQQSTRSVEQMQVSVEALQAVVAGLNDNDGLNQQIAAATEQQSQTVKQISEEVADIHRLASDTAQTLTETVQAGESVGYHVTRQKYLIKQLAPGKQP